MASGGHSHILNVTRYGEYELIGQTREKIAECARRHGFNNIMFAENLEEAVRVCASYAEEGDYVLLSPACASWGQFPNFEVRGEKFKEYVRAL